MPAPHLEQRSQSGSTLGVYSSVVFSHSLQNLAQTHIPDSPAQHGGKNILYFSTVNLAPSTRGGGQENKSWKLAWISRATRGWQRLDEWPGERDSCLPERIMPGLVAEMAYEFS